MKLEECRKWISDFWKREGLLLLLSQSMNLGCVFVVEKRRENIRESKEKDQENIRKIKR
uniref:Uncharacterized protein n=1 Tax=Medicago truncatula TaxID=3880 RepID=Q2HRS5_MEDTR|nr:hypothetical protein MtrDRAFT_AC157894g20v2 [Medicago truncatula]